MEGENEIPADVVDVPIDVPLDAEGLGGDI
jgi:hypothetical protein